MMLPFRLPSSRAVRWALPCLLALAACGPTLEVPDDAAACEGIRCTAGECFSNAGQPMCRCGEWEQAAGVACQVALFEQPDDHGGTPAEATVLRPAATPLEGRISNSRREGQADLDLFAVTSEARHVYAFMLKQGSLKGGHLRVLDGGGRVAPHIVLPSDTDARTLWMFATLDVGTWYVEVSAPGDAGSYTYQLLDLGTDDHGDSRETATPLQDVHHQRFTVTHTFAEDADVFAFRAARGHGYRFICEVPGGRGSGRLSTELRLTTSSGAPVDEASAKEGPASLAVGVTALVEEVYFVTVRARSASFLSTTACWFEALGQDEHSDVPSGATPLSPGFPVRVALQSDGDRDVFTFLGEPGHVYSLRTEPEGSWPVEVRDAAGRILNVTNTGQLGLKSGTADRFFLAVEAGTSVGRAFQLTLVDQGPDDHGNSMDTATRITLGASTTGRVQAPGDVDAFRFDAPDPDGIYALTCEPRCTLYFSGTFHLATRGLASGTYLLGPRTSEPVGILVESTSAPGDFTLKLERVATDDHADDPGSAEVLPLPASRSGVLQTAVDEDVFAVWLTAGGRYRLDLEVRPPAVFIDSLYGPAVNVEADGTFTAPVSGYHHLRFGGAPDLEERGWRFSLQAL